MYHSRFSGTHYEAGFTYGALLKKRGITLTTCPTFPITKKRLRFGQACIEAIQPYYPQIIEEVRGMAAGNDCDLAFLNALIFTMFCHEDAVHCSCFAYRKEDEIVFGRNSDFLVSIEKSYSNVLYHLDEAIAFTGNTTAFIEIEDGVNAYGLAIGITFIPVHTIQPGFNIGILTRYLLETCTNVEEALQVIQQLPIACGGTLTLADKRGHIAVAEVSPQAIHIQEGEAFVCSTNVYQNEAMRAYQMENVDHWRAQERYETLHHALTKEKPSIPFAQKLLGGAYGFLCQYDRRTNADTVWSVLYDVSKQDIYRVEGNPSRKPFQKDERFTFWK